MECILYAITILCGVYCFYWQRKKNVQMKKLIVPIVIGACAAILATGLIVSGILMNHLPVHV